ncbi:ASCH domain-containing protein [Ferrovibrio terrae]|uniref:ASCH domain-containing protein n=1 Tax=Ferrovibrio terrae TaxID=2594003 RepID=UPI0031379389
MTDYHDILISLHPEYTDAMLAGVKTVELRRRPVRVAQGGRVWIYTTTPRAIVEAVGIVKQVVVAHPSRIWSRYREETAISKKDFDKYFIGAGVGCGIVFESIYSLNQSVSLAELRRRFKSFHPPQFYKSLTSNSAELRYLENLQNLPTRKAA